MAEPVPGAGHLEQDGQNGSSHPILENKVSSTSEAKPQVISPGSDHEDSPTFLLSSGGETQEDPGILPESHSEELRGDSDNQSSMLLPDILRVGSPPSVASRMLSTFRKPSVSYEPLSRAEKPDQNTSGTTGGNRLSVKRKGFLLGLRHGPIPEEEIDMSLLGAASSMGSTSYGNVEEDETSFSPIAGGGFDLSSLTGPSLSQDEAHLKELNRQEAAGILTGGLGAGILAETTIKSSELYASAPPTPVSPTTPSARIARRVSYRNVGIARTLTIRDLGQREANKQGKVVEVIVDDEPSVESEATTAPPVDISSLDFGGTPTSDVDRADVSLKPRTETFVSSSVEIFYPQANWKPFSMRWPYLTALIVISVILAVAQEYLCRQDYLYQFNSPSALRTWDYFSFKYLPTLVAVSFGILWQITDFEVKRLEAFYQLSREGGALAAESLNIDYITFFNFLRPFKALRFRHYAVAVSSIATLLAVSAVPTLQAASVELSPDRETRLQHPTGLKTIKINPVFSRILSVVLVLIAVFGCILVYQLQRRPSGLVADVKGIAGIAAMANRSHILMDFKNMDTATPEMIHNQLKMHRYSLRNSSLAPEYKLELSQEEKDKYDAQRKHPENPHPLMLRLVAGIPFVVGMLIFMLLVPIILFEKNANIVTDKAPWLLTGLAVCIKLAWGTLETDVRMIEPFYILSKRHASPKVLTLDYTAMAFGWMPIRAFINGHILVGLVGLGSVLAEVLTVCATSFGNVSGEDFVSKSPPPSTPSPSRFVRAASSKPGSGVNAGEETFASFWVSFAFALAILTFLCFVAILVYARRRHPFLPRQPNTIASILAFIHQSKMLYDFVGTEKMNNDEMARHLVAIGKTYGLGWFTGRDGEMHCGVDEEELAGAYKHGDDARKATMPWTTNWSDF